MPAVQRFLLTGITNSFLLSAVSCVPSNFDTSSFVLCLSIDTFILLDFFSCNYISSQWSKIRSERSYQPLTPHFHRLIFIHLAINYNFFIKKDIIDLFTILCKETNYEIYWKMLIRKICFKWNY